MKSVRPIKQGYTLLEIMIALVVFAILATLTSGVMYYAFANQERVARQAEQLNTLQAAILLLERDTQQAVYRSALGTDHRFFPAFIGQARYFELTRGGLVNPMGLEHRSTLQRVAYACEKDQLLRRSWDRVDTPLRDRFHEKILLSQLQSCQFAYIDSGLQVLSEWRENAVQLNQKKSQLPVAVQVNLTLAAGTMSLLFAFPRGQYAD